MADSAAASTTITFVQVHMAMVAWQWVTSVILSQLLYYLALPKHLVHVAITTISYVVGHLLRAIVTVDSCLLLLFFPAKAT